MVCMPVIDDRLACPISFAAHGIL